MLELFLKQLTLIGALSAIVLAALWPHVQKLLQTIQGTKPLAILIRNFYGSESGPKDGPKKLRSDDHPRLSGRTLRRMTSEKRPMLSLAHERHSGIGQGSSPLRSQPSLSIGQDHSYHHLLSGQNSPTGSARDIPPGHISQTGPSSSLSLTIFSGFTIALIFYTMMRLLTARLGRINADRSGEQAANERPPTKFKERRGNGSSDESLKALARMGLASRDHDLRYDKSRLNGLNREERAKRLILHHGSKNVALAMKFLIQELEKQKQLLISADASNEAECSQVDGTSDANDICTCSCHPKG